MLGLFQRAGSLHTLILSVQLGLCSTSKARGDFLGFFPLGTEIWVDKLELERNGVFLF